MKKNNTISNIIIVIFCLTIIGGLMGFNGEKDVSPAPENITTNVAKLISSQKSLNNFQQVNLFTPAAADNNPSAFNDFVRKGSLLKLSESSLNSIFSSRENNVEFSIPDGSPSGMVLELTQVRVTGKDFKLKDLSTGRETKVVDEGLYYRGIIKGDNSSIASISIFHNFVMGVISNNDGNYVLGSIKDANKNYTSNYIFYNDKDIKNQVKFTCGDENREDMMVNHLSNNTSFSGVTPKDNVSPDTINVFYVTDNAMYLQSGSDLTTLQNFVKGFFNSVATIYQNENIPFQISGIAYYTSADPYVNDSDSYNILLNFGNNIRDNFMGDLTQLISTGHNGTLGGIAWINVLCQPATNDPNAGGYVGRFSFANIEPGYNPYPTYSWTVTVSTHEMGHNLGSYHTHACHWRLPNGGIGPLDTCIVTQENSSFSGNGGCINSQPVFQCYQPDNPAISGFVMSYCHFCEHNGGGINLANGFGRPFGSFMAQSGDTIRARFINSSCLHRNVNSSETPTLYTLLQNFPNPFNPSTDIRFALPQAGFVTLKVYDVTGREVAILLSNKQYDKGIFNYTLDASFYNMASGVYFYRLDVNNDNKNIYTQIKKMVLVK